VSDDCKDIIQKLLDPNPNSRFSAKECLQHKWFEKMDKTYEITSNKIDTSTLVSFNSYNRLQKSIWSYIS